MDVVAAANNQIPLAADDLEIAAWVEAAEIAGEEPAAAVERTFGRLLIVEIAEHQTGAAAADLADLARHDLDIGVLLVEQANLIGAARLAASRDDRLGGVGRQRVLVRTVLAHAVDVLRDNAAIQEGLRDLARDRRAGHVKGLDGAEPVETAAAHLAENVHRVGRHAHDVAGAGLEDPVERCCAALL